MTTPNIWKCANSLFKLNEPLIMGILNVTPDSFSDGGIHNELEGAIQWAKEMVQAGAHIIDVGGESTRPGFNEKGVSLEEERKRVIPVVKALLDLGFVVSVDTSKPEIMKEVASLGAQIINDIRGFTLPGAIEVASQTDCGLVIMHRSLDGKYDSLIGDVSEFLKEQTDKFLKLGVDKSRICWDPGFGFGKNLEQNFELIAATPIFLSYGYPIMTALSRKRSIGAVVNEDIPKNRALGSAVASMLGAQLGARVLRVHDVKETKQALSVLKAIESASKRI